VAAHLQEIDLGERREAADISAGRSGGYTEPGRRASISSRRASVSSCRTSRNPSETSQRNPSDRR
jgi:hypothetical protein